MKKLTCILLCCALLSGFCISAADSAQEAENARFVTLMIPYEGEEPSWSDSNYLIARFADTKQPIPLSQYYDGYVYATIPAADSEREVELFQSSPVAFADEPDGWEPLSIKALSARGILKGTEEGNVERARSITRAEAVAIIVRLLSLEEYEVKEEMPPEEMPPEEMPPEETPPGETPDESGAKNPDETSEVPEDVESSAGDDSGETPEVPGDVDSSANEPAEEASGVFDDVDALAWYAPAVATALESGIIMPDTFFNPLRLVTRQEFTVMAYRAFKALGWISQAPEGTALTNIKDASAIAAYAKEAYLALSAASSIGIFTYVDNYDVILADGGPSQDCYSYPANPATRENSSELLYQMLTWLPVYPTEKAVTLGFAEAMPVIDGSTATYPITQAVYGSLFKNYTQHELYPDSHSKTTESYERLIAGEVDLLFVSVEPSSEILELAKAKGVEFEITPIGYDAQVFFTNYANEIKGLTSEQITEIYVNNAYENWSELGGPDAKLVPYCRNSDSGSHALMEKFFLNGGEIHKDILLENTSMEMHSILTDVAEVWEYDNGAFGLGYSIYYYYQAASMVLVAEDSLKLLEIDGVYPTDETIANGSYPLADNCYVVIRKDAPKNSPERKMAAFILSETGQNCVQNAGYGRIK